MELENNALILQPKRLVQLAALHLEELTLVQTAQASLMAVLGLGLLTATLLSMRAVLGVVKPVLRATNVLIANLLLIVA